MFKPLFSRVLVFMTAWFLAAVVTAQAQSYYTEPQVHRSRPNPQHDSHLGPIGVTGIFADVKKGVRVTVEKTEDDSPAAGKFKQGDVIIGVNGVDLKGKNPLVALGEALTKAEATDGRMTFLVEPVGESTSTEVSLDIPVLGAYSDRFPIDCEKSKRIIRQAAAFYSGEERLQEHGFLNGLACLFLLSTGDDAYLPRVKEYFSQFLDQEHGVEAIGAMTWDNGYNGVACAEYYLRTGDRSVLPILQYYCDDARDRQVDGMAWPHWGTDSFPSYEAGGGMMHCAGNQVLLTLVLGKMCGVKVDHQTLLGAIRHWYRFAGHGAIPCSDQRSWPILRSAGRDGATACVMHVASQASGGVSIYLKAREYLAMSALSSWPARQYNWETYWHGLGGQFMLDIQPDAFHRTAKRFQWRLDLSRMSSGAFYGNNDSGALKREDMGIAYALAYTAPLRNLCITGAARSKFAVEFTMPEWLWGNQADLAFLTADHHKDYYKHGKEDEMHLPYQQLRISEIQASPGHAQSLPDSMLLKNVRHARFSVRVAAAKALCMKGNFGELEALLRDPDPRLRRAALDGINDYSAWFTFPTMGRQALKADDFTPGMIEAINGMLTNPDESWFVIDGALTALGHAPHAMIKENWRSIISWSKHPEWWLREAAFTALMGLKDHESYFLGVLPYLTKIMLNEHHYNPRHKMLFQLQSALKEKGPESRVGKVIAKGLKRATVDSKVMPDKGEREHSRTGMANIAEVVILTIQHNPELAYPIVRFMVDNGQLASLSDRNLADLVKLNVGGHGHARYVGLHSVLSTIDEAQRYKLSKLLREKFLPELQKRLKNAELELADLAPRPDPSYESRASRHLQGNINRCRDIVAELKQLQP